MRFAVDTNVLVVANGNASHASIRCELACIEWLQTARAKPARFKILLDHNGLVLNEYERHMSYAGQPGVGDAFFKYLHDHQHGHKGINLVNITPTPGTDAEFHELPKNELDVSDQKFLAVAVVGGGRIVNAVDSDWMEQATLLAELSVKVTQLCLTKKMGV